MCRKSFGWVAVVVASVVVLLVAGGITQAATIGLWDFEEFSIGDDQVPVGANAVTDKSGNFRNLTLNSDGTSTSHNADIRAGRDPGSKAISLSGVDQNFLYFDAGGGSNPFLWKSSCLSITTPILLPARILQKVDLWVLATGAAGI